MSAATLEEKRKLGKGSMGQGRRLSQVGRSQSGLRPLCRSLLGGEPGRGTAPGRQVHGASQRCSGRVPHDDRHVPGGPVNFPFSLKQQQCRRTNAAVCVSRSSMIVRTGCQERGSFGAICIPCHLSSCFFIPRARVVS